MVHSHTYTYRTSSVLWGTSFLHIVAAIVLLLDPSAGAGTAVHAIMTVLGGRLVTAAYLVLFSFMAMGSILRLRGTGRLLCLLPQQALMTFAASGAVVAIVTGHFADGVQRPIGFIIDDQLPTIGLALMHTYAIVRGARGP